MAGKLAPSTRHQFLHEGRVIYEWDQTISEVNLYVQVPPGVKAKDLFVIIDSQHLSLGVKPNPPYLNVSEAAVDT
jgi:CS domain